MTSRPDRGFWILAEPESLYLPDLVAQLACHGAVRGIVEIRFRVSLSTRVRHLLRFVRAFGWASFVKASLGVPLGMLLNLTSADRYFSLAKVARRFGLPFHVCSGFGDPSLGRVLDQEVGSDPVLVQVGRRVPAELTRRYLLINKHCSRLPDFGGVCPVFWSLLEGAGTLGVTLHRMTEDVDSGPILRQVELPVGGTLFGAYHALYDATTDLALALLRDDAPAPAPTSGPPVRLYPYPTPESRRQFLARGHRFGSPFRYHPPRARAASTTP